MKYIDSGNPTASEAVGTWLQAVLSPDVVELRWQTGFFSADALTAFENTLRRLAVTDLPTHLLIGSNDGETLQAHVTKLVDLTGIPRSRARLGIVYFSGSYFHPKVYHLRRSDGSQAAYVGSANLTMPGITGSHVEAGIILDTRDGDPASIISEIASRIDDWFQGPRAGLELVSGHPDVHRLTATGILAAVPPPRLPSTSGGNGAGGTSRPRRQPLIRLPVFIGTTAPAISAPPTPSLPIGASLPAVPKHPPYPTYVLFDPGATTPTRGASALSGATLPGNYAGIVLKLNQDSARHWSGGSGTANISIPVPTIGALRFGIYAGRNGDRPRAEYDVEMRYLASQNDLRVQPRNTNIMVYGFSQGDTGHGDVRLVVPKPPSTAIGALITAAHLPLPKDGDVAFLEWPSFNDPTFRLTLLDQTSPLGIQAAQSISAASVSGQLVGRGACWLPRGLSPAW